MLPHSSSPDARLALAHAARDSVRAALTVITPVYVVLGGLHLLLLARPGAYVMAGLAFATAAVTGAGWWAVARRGISEARSQRTLNGLAGAVLLNSLVHLYVVGEAADTTNLLLLISGAGYIVLSRSALLGLILLAWAGWAGAVLMYPGEPWARYLFAMVAATVLSGLVQAVRVRTTVHLQQLRAELEVRVDARTHELAASNALLRTLIDALPDAICIRDRDGVHRLANQTACAWLDGASIVGRTHREVRPEADLAVEEAEDAAVLWSGDTIVERAAVGPRDPQGGTRRLVVSKYPVRGPAGEVTGVLDVRRDVTEALRTQEARIEMEQRLFHAQKLQSLGVLTGGIAHDFNNLLTSVLGAASLIRLDATQPVRVEAHVRHVETAALQAADLCRQLLAYAGQGRVVVERADLGAVVENVVPLLRMSASRQVDMQVRRAPIALPIDADTSQMRQVVMNLVINAAEAVADRSDGQVRVSCSAVDVAAGEVFDRSTSQPLAPGRYGCLAVEDNGPGLPADLRDRIFDPFFTTKFTGRGLGLAVVLGIVRGHHGAVLVDDRAGGGASFRVLLPLVTPAAPTPSRAAALASGRLAGEALLVDDERAVRDVMGSMLERLGLTVVTASDGRAGLEIFLEDPVRFTVVVVDLTMPTAGGREVLRQLRASGHTVPVLLVSGYADGDVVLADLADPSARFLQKPFTLVALRDALASLLPATD